METSFQKLVDTLSEALCILDFSYLISGSLCFLAIIFDLSQHGVHFYIYNTTLTVLTGILLSYVCGLFAWIIGKRIRRNRLFLTKKCPFMNVNTTKFNNDFNSIFDNAVNSLTKEQKETIAQFTSNQAYTYMWAKLNSIKAANERMKFIHRFWVMQALYEGMISFAILGLCVFADYLYLHLTMCPTMYELIVITLVVTILLTVFFLSSKEAKNCAINQINEVVIAYHIYQLNQ